MDANTTRRGLVVHSPKQTILIRLWSGVPFEVRVRMKCAPPPVSNVSASVPVPVLCPGLLRVPTRVSPLAHRAFGVQRVHLVDRPVQVEQRGCGRSRGVSARRAPSRWGA